MGFLGALINIFSGGNDPETLKKKQLQKLVKELSQNKYSKFYHAKTGELDPAFAKFLYDIYKVVSAAQVFVQNAAKSEQLKQITIDTFMDKDLLALKDNLSADSIQKRAKTMPVKDLAPAVKRELSNFIAAFDTARVNSIDNCYNAIISLIRFVSYDFFFLLKKFDTALTERNFAYQPKFHNIKAAEATNTLKDFIEYSAGVEADRDWKTAMAVLKTYKEGVDVVIPDQWSKIIRVLKDVSRTKILELIIKHAASDPLWMAVPRLVDERIIDKVLDAKKTEIEGALNKIQNDKRSAQIDQIAKNIFGSTEVNRLSNYVSKANDAFYKKNFEGFTKTAAVNYLKAYLLDFFKKEIRELCDLLLVRGQWGSVTLSKPMSDAYHDMMSLSDEIIEFDESLSEKGEHGARLKQALLKVDRDKGQGRYIRIILKTVNNNAQRMINTASTCLITIGKNFKSLLEDMPKNPHELITNWKELESSANFDMPLGKRMAEDYKRMFFFVQLMQFFTGPLEEEDSLPSSLGSGSA